MILSALLETMGGGAGAGSEEQRMNDYKEQVEANRDKIRRVPEWVTPTKEEER